MIDIAWSEFLFIALLALILIGPKELPSVLRNIGRWIGKARAFAKDISEQLDLYTHSDESPDHPRDNQDHKTSESKEPREPKTLKTIKKS
jgi:sec-independent protein translocase protein TatB